MPSYYLGKDAKLYWKATPIDGSVVTAATITNDGVESGTDGIVAGNVQDLQLNVDSDFVEATTRAEAAAGFKAEIAVLKNAELTFDARWDPSDAFFTALINAWLNSTEIALVELDQVATVAGGAQGLAGNFTIAFNIDKPLNDIQKVSVTAKGSSQLSWFTDPDNS